MEEWRYLMVKARGVFRTHSNIYHGAFFRKHLAAFRRWLFSWKSSIVNVELGSKYASEYDSKFISWRLQIKVNDFLNFLTINFSYQYLPEAKTCLKPSRTSTMELFREKYFFLQNSLEKTCARASF